MNSTAIFRMVIRGPPFNLPSLCVYFQNLAHTYPAGSKKRKSILHSVKTLIDLHHLGSLTNVNVFALVMSTQIFKQPHVSELSSRLRELIDRNADLMTSDASDV